MVQIADAPRPAKVEVVELPGMIGYAEKCPNCTLLQPQHDNEKDKDIPSPTHCPRCGGPWDLELFPAFSDARARQEQQDWPKKEEFEKPLTRSERKQFMELLKEQAEREAHVA